MILSQHEEQGGGRDLAGVAPHVVRMVVIRRPLQDTRVVRKRLVVFCDENRGRCMSQRKAKSNDMNDFANRI